MENIPKISESEWLIMEVLWDGRRLTANDIVSALANEISWKPKTVKTLLNRLLKKKAIGFDTKGREYIYYPIHEKDACVMAESQSFLNRVFKGSLKPMLASFIESHTLSPEEIEDLKNILEGKYH